MSENPNHKFIGKTVMVIGAHNHKGITGKIKDVTLDNYAFVELDIFNCPLPEKFTFTVLRLVYVYKFSIIILKTDSFSKATRTI